MISDTLSDARADIQHYLEAFPNNYAELRPQIDDLLSRMEALHTILDAPPGLTMAFAQKILAVGRPSDGEVDAAARILYCAGRHHGWFPEGSAEYDAMDPISKSEFGGLVEEMLMAAAAARNPNLTTSKNHTETTTTRERSISDIIEHAHYDVGVDIASFEKLGGTEVNTKITYLYRDADNYKQFGTAIFKGAMTSQQLETILAHLDEDGGFIPGQVGMRDLQEMMATGWDNDLDHPFHEITSIKLTEQPADNVSIDELARLFAEVSWDQDYHP